MKIIGITVFVFFAAGCAIDRSTARRDAVGETIQFRLSPGFTKSTEISLSRTHDGTILGTVLEYPAFHQPGDGGVIVLKKFSVKSDSFASLSDAFEDSKLRAAAEKMPIPSIDGTGWIFRKQIGSRLIEYGFWRSNTEGWKIAQSLGRRFTAMASMQDLLRGETEPNHSSARPSSDNSPASETPFSLGPRD